MHRTTLTWQVAQIHQAEMLKEAAKQRIINSVPADSRKASPPGLAIAFAAAPIVLWLVWMFAAG